MQSTIQYIKSELKGLYPESEIDGFIRIIAETVLHLNYTEWLLRKELELLPADKKRIERVLERLKNNEPIQYIFGETEFFNLPLRVAPGVLIPRSETEELVQWILDLKPMPDVRIVDVGTGSACIALALKKNVPQSELIAVDFSEDALRIAAENAIINKLDVQFLLADILSWEKQLWKKYDIIVSNPPYVRNSEKKLMHPNVLKHEPETALFVSDEDPLLFYRVIATFALKNLNVGGYLFFEINEAFGKQTIELLEQLGFRDIVLKKDINRKDRMVRCRK
jgi:release factor glutamine methyltransferase